MDAAGLDVICLMSPRPDLTAKSHRECMEVTAKQLAADPKRIRAFYRVDPRLKDAPAMVERAIAKHGYAGVKMLPDHWFPYDRKVQPTLARVDKLGVPVLFHSGILWANEDSSRFCRPAGYEIMQRYEHTRFMLAHVSWPWTDECIAVADRFKTMARMKQCLDPALGGDYAMRHVHLHEKRYEPDVAMKVDITPGTPAIYRAEVLRKCCEVLGADMLVFGTDSRADNLSGVKDHIARDERIFRDELHLPEADIDRIMGTNLLKMFEKI
jgi:predicted TIM-barrel fold metal-dependent hydrolase